MMQPYGPQSNNFHVCLWLASLCLLISPATLRAQAPPAPSPSEQEQQPVPSEEKPGPPATPPQESPKPAPAPKKRLSQREHAWQILHDGLAENNGDKRAKAVNSLGLLTRNAEAEKAAVLALKDDKSNVRVAAASALGSMRALHAQPELESALDDDEPAVVLAVANSLMLLKDMDSAYEVYYGVLTGTTRTSKGLIKEQLKILKNKKKLAEIGIEQGIGFIPFAGFGYDAWKTIMKSDSSSVRAAAAKKLTHDPSPATADALVSATQDKNWLVRAAALEAISERGDKTLLPKINLSLDDEKDDVRFTAAACVAHLSTLPGKRAKAAPAAGN
jgi:HEAT repeat protein